MTLEPNRRQMEKWWKTMITSTTFEIVISHSVSLLKYGEGSRTNTHKNTVLKNSRMLTCIAGKHYENTSWKRGLTLHWQCTSWRSHWSGSGNPTSKGCPADVPRSKRLPDPTAELRTSRPKSNVQKSETMFEQMQKCIEHTSQTRKSIWRISDRKMIVKTLIGQSDRKLWERSYNCSQG